MERWRWMPDDLGADHVIVNIAGYELKLVQGGKDRRRMAVVVGKPYSRTPVFSDARPLRRAQSLLERADRHRHQGRTAEF